MGLHQEANTRQRRPLSHDYHITYNQFHGMWSALYNFMKAHYVRTTAVYWGVICRARWQLQQQQWVGSSAAVGL